MCGQMKGNTPAARARDVGMCVCACVNCLTTCMYWYKWPECSGYHYKRSWLHNVMVGRHVEAELFSVKSRERRFSLCGSSSSSFSILLSPAVAQVTSPVNRCSTGDSGSRGRMQTGFPVSRRGPRPFYIACSLKVFHNSIDAFSNMKHETKSIFTMAFKRIELNCKNV